MINRILFYNSGGGIGDAIQLLPLINSVKKEFNSANFFYLCSHKNHFNATLLDLNSTIDTLELNIKYFGFRWWHLLAVKKQVKKLNINKFDLIIDLQSKIRNTLILKRIPHEYLISTCFNFKFSKPSLNIKKRSTIINDVLDALNVAFKKNCKLVEYNTKNIEAKFFEEAQKLLPNNNYVGFSITQGNIYRKKEWPLITIVNICKKIKLQNKIPVFFIEKKNTYLKKKISSLIPESLFPEHESNLSSPALVTCLGKRLDFAVSIDNGVMHMLALGKVPMIVLFGPTSSTKFAPNYKNLVVLDSKKIKNTSDISSISVEDVLQAAKQHLNF